MQLGMIGLGRMGANMVRRLLKGGHQCVVFDRSPKAVAELVKEKAVGTTSLADFVKKLAKPRAVWLMVPAAVVDRRIADLLPHLEARRHPDRRRQLLLHRRYPPRQGADCQRHPLRRRRHERRRLGAGARLLHDDRRRARRGEASRSDLRHARPRTSATSRVRRDARRSAAPPSRAICIAGRNGAGHFVKMVHNGIEYGVMAAYAEGMRGPARPPISASTPAAIDAETTPLRDPEHYQYDLNLPDIAEVWRRGSVIASWLLDLSAAALIQDPALAKFAGRVSDSGEGRWTIKAAIDEGVPAPVLSSALYERFSSRGEADFADKLLSAMRYEFGGHLGESLPQKRAGVVMSTRHDLRRQRQLSSRRHDQTNDLDQLAINTIRTLSIDAVQQAKSGHPGTPMALAPLVYTIWNRVMRFDPEGPDLAQSRPLRAVQRPRLDAAVVGAASDRARRR